MSNHRYSSNKVIRCVNSSALHDIRRDQYKCDVVCVYYGFDNYNKTVEQIVALSDLVKNEMPDVSTQDMDVCEITRNQSNRHAGQTMIQVRAKAECVSQNIENYVVL